MSSWGNKDAAANAPYWAVNSTVTHGTYVANNAAKPTAANVALLYANTTADVYRSGQTIGLFGVDEQEAGVNHNVTHQGWVVKTTGSGGRANRIQHEVLVAMSSMGYSSTDGDQQLYPNVAISITGPSNGSVISEASYANVVTFSISTSLSGNTSAALTYQWQYDNAGTWANIPANTVPIQWSGKTSTTLHVRPKTTANNGTTIRAIVYALDEGVTAYSQNATITIT
jgi:hypothetical protein